MRFPFFRNRDSVKNGILISIRRTGDGFHPGLFIESNNINFNMKNEGKEDIKKAHITKKKYTKRK